MATNDGSNNESSMPSEFHSIAVEESRYVLNRQFETVSDLSNFSFEMLKLNIVLVGALLSAVPLGDQLGIPARQFINVYSATGIVLLFGSILAATVTHTFVRPTAVLQLSPHLDHISTREEFYELLSESYA